MAKQTFTTGQVLTAAQMTSLQQTAMGGGSATAKTASYVLVAADAGTTVAMNAAGATTITVNTGLFAAGDTVFIQNLGAGACTVTAGTATVATAGSLILPQNDAGILYFTSASAAIFYDYIQAGAVSPLTTKGDLYTFSTSDARLAVGTNTHVLTADSAEATGLKWAAPAAGGMTSIASGSLSGGSLSLTSISGSYNDLVLYLTDWAVSADGGWQIKLNNDTTSGIYQYIQSTIKDATIAGGQGNRASEINLSEAYNPKSGDRDSAFAMTLTNYANTTAFKNGSYTARFVNQDAGLNPVVVQCVLGYGSTSAITRIDIFLSGVITFTGGTYVLYGVK